MVKMALKKIQEFQKKYDADLAETREEARAIREKLDNLSSSIERLVTGMSSTQPNPAGISVQTQLPAHSTQDPAATVPDPMAKAQEVPRYQPPPL